MKTFRSEARRGTLLFVRNSPLTLDERLWRLSRLIPFPHRRKRICTAAPAAPRSGFSTAWSGRIRTSTRSWTWSSKAAELSDLDKGLLNEIVHGVLRWQNRLDWVLNGFSHGNFAKSEINIKNTLRVALYQILFLDRVPHSAAVNEGVEFIKRIRGEKPAGLVNAVLRNIIRNIDGIRYPDPDEDPVQHLSVYYSHPHWMVRRWVARFGVEETKRFLIAANERPSLSLRINRLKIEPGAFLGLLEQQADRVHRVDVHGSLRQGEGPGGYRPDGPVPRRDVHVQDESAALPCLLLDPAPGERVIDLCAAPGGKTTNLAEMMRNQGEVVAVDKHEAKLGLIRASCDRLGLQNVTLLAADSAALETEPGRQGAARRSLLRPRRPRQEARHEMEAGCLRHPEAHEDPEGDPRKRGPAREAGGVLVYCDVHRSSPKKTRRSSPDFLARHPEFRLEGARRT